MEEAMQRALVINMAILAKADGKVDPEEVGYIKEFLTRSGITTLKANGWLREVKESHAELQPIHIGEDTEDLLKILIGLVAADKHLSKAEGEQLVRIAKACNVSAPALARLISKNWRRKILDDLMPADKQHPAAGAPLRKKVTVVTDYFNDLNEFITAHSALDFKARTMQEIMTDLEGEAPDYLVFHASPDRSRSVQSLQTLRDKFPLAGIAALVRRDQAFQIRYLIEAGAAQCLVQPIFPNELAKVIDERAR